MRYSEADTHLFFPRHARGESKGEMQPYPEDRPSDDLPPATVITYVRRLPGGGLLVCGTTSDDYAVKSVTVNGREARATWPNFASGKCCSTR